MKMYVPISGGYISVVDEGVYNPAIWFSRGRQDQRTWGWIRREHDHYLPRNWFFVGYDFQDDSSRHL